MSPCCLAAAAAAAALTALIVVGLSAFVLVTDGFGLGILVATLLTIGFQKGEAIGPCAPLLDAFSILLIARATWLLATARRSLVVAAWRVAHPRASWVVRNLTPLRWVRHSGSSARNGTAHIVDAPVILRIGPRPD